MLKSSEEVAGVPETSIKRPGTSADGQIFKKLKSDESSPDLFHQDLLGRVGFDDLPDELVVKILSHLSMEDQLLNIARVSKRFHRLSQDTDVHASVRLPDLNESSSVNVVKFLSGKSKIREVSMNMNSRWSPLAFKLAVMDQRVSKSLVLADDSFTALKMLEENPEKARQIRTLFIYSGCAEAAAACNAPELANLVEFEYQIDREADYDGRVANLIANIALKSERLESFISKHSIKVEHMKNILDRHGQRLKKLHLRYTGGVTNRIAKRIIRMPKLEELHLDAADLSHYSVFRLCMIKSLRVIRIRNFAFVPWNLGHIFSYVDFARTEEIILLGTHGDDHRTSRVCLNRSSLSLRSMEGLVTFDNLLTLVKHAAEKSVLKELRVQLHQEVRTSGSGSGASPSTELLFQIGRKIFLRSHSAFLPKEKLVYLIYCLTSHSPMPPLETVEIVHDDTTLTAELVRNMKIPGLPSVMVRT